MFWTDSRLKRTLLAITAALAISVIFVWVTDTEQTSMLKRGDFPGFYSPAVILDRGLEDQLYDLGLQRAIQNEFWSGLSGEYNISVYPPFVAQLLRPMARFCALTAKVIWTTAMFCFVLLSLYFLSAFLPFIKDQPVVYLCGSFLFTPLFCGVFAAQNTALSLLLFCLGLTFLALGSKRGDLLAGLAFGLWLYKPQYALLAIVFSFFYGRLWTLIGASLPALFFYAIATSKFGPFWPLDWMTSAASFGFRNYENNGHQMVSIVGGLKSLMAFFAINRQYDNLVFTTGVVLSTVVFIVAIVAMRKVKRERMSTEGFPRELLLMAPAIVLISPQTLFYDLGICLPALMAFWRPSSDKRVALAFGFFFIVAVAALLRPYLDFPFFFFIALGVFIYIYRHLRDPSLDE